MKIKEVIEIAKSLRQGCVLTEKNAVRWLRTLDEIIKLEIHDTSEGTEQVIDFNSYDGETELLVPEPYCELYISYLCAQIDKSVGELNRYNNEISVFENTYSRYSAFYNRTHNPKNKNFKW